MKNNEGLIEELGALNKKFDSLVLSSNRRCKNDSLNGVNMKFMQHNQDGHCLIHSHKVKKVTIEKPAPIHEKVMIRQ